MSIFTIRFDSKGQEGKGRWGIEINKARWYGRGGSCERRIDSNRDGSYERGRVEYALEMSECICVPRAISCSFLSFSPVRRNWQLESEV